MNFHSFVYCTIGTRPQIEAGMAGKKPELYQNMLEEIGEYARYCDDIGFTGFGHPEHHLEIEGLEVANEPGLLSMFIGMQTKKLRVDLFGYALPGHNPLRVAEHVATLDHMLKGRLNVAFVRGYQERWLRCLATKPGLTGVGPWNKKDPADVINREYYEESIAVIKKAWANDTFSHKGKYWNFPPENLVNPHEQPTYLKYGQGVDEDYTIREVGIAPKTYQQPHPPLYSGFTASMTTALYWAKEGGKPVVLGDNLEFCKTIWNAYRQEAERHGREIPYGEEAAWGGYLILADTDEEAQEWAKDAYWMWDNWALGFGMPYPAMIIGGPETVKRRIREAREAVPFNECFFLLGQGILGRDKVMKTLDLFANKVMPEFVDM